MAFDVILGRPFLGRAIPGDDPVRGFVRGNSFHADAGFGGTGFQSREITIGTGLQIASAGSRTVIATFKASLDRKSTRLNSSHGSISYAVFCLKKKKNKQYENPSPTHRRKNKLH